MQARHLLLTSVASVSLLIAASHMPEAMAQKGTFLSPSSQWAVTKVAGNPSAGQAGYCAVAKRYGGDAILTIARNQGSETSFALDLQKPIFNTAKSIAVTLDPGAGEQRDYSISPASSQAFVVRLGSDDAFFNAIDRTGMLRVEAADESYVFNISDIGDGQSKLVSCLASAVQPAAGNAAPVSFGTQVESSSNKEFIAELNARIQSLETQNQSLQAKVVDVERQPLSVAKDDAASSEASLRLEELRRENLKLKSALQTGEIEMRSEKMSLLESDNKRLSHELSRQSNISQQVQQLQGRIDALLSENARLKTAQVNMPHAELSSLRDDIQTLEAENSSLKVALASQSEVPDVSEQLRARIAQVENENRQLKSEQIGLQGQASSSSAGIEARHSEEIAVLNARIEGLRLAQNLDAEDDQTIEELTGQLASLRADNLLLQQELHEKDAAGTLASVELGLGEETLATLEFENKKLHSQLEKSSAAYTAQDKAIVALEAENLSLKSQLNGIDVASVDDLSVKLDRLTTALADSQAERVAQEEKLAALMDENVGLKGDLDSKVAENLSLATAFDDVSALKVQIAEKDAKLASFEGVPQRLQSLLNDYKVAKAETQKLEAENAALRDSQLENADLVAKLANAEAINQTFEARLEGMQESVLQMAALNEEVKGLQLALVEKENRIEELDGLQVALSEAVAENAALKERADAFELAQNDAQLRVNKDLANENIELRRSLSSVIAKVEGQNEVLVQKEAAFSTVLAQNEALQGQLDVAAQLMASNAANAAEASLREDVAMAAPVVKKRVAEPEARVILASARADVSAPKPSVKPVRPAVVDDQSFAERLAQIEPAAGDEPVEAEVGVTAVDVIEAPEVMEDAQEFMDRDLNQAQIYEEQLKRSLQNQEVIAESRDAPIDVEMLEDDLIAQDDLDAVIEKVATPESLPALDDVPVVAEIEEGVDEAVEDLASQDTLEDAPINPSSNAIEDAQEFTAQVHEQANTTREDVELKMSQDPFEGIAVEGEDDATVAAAVNDVQESVEALPSTLVQPKSTPIEVLSDAPAQDAVAASGGGAVERVLMMANVSGVTSVAAVADKEGAYQWRAGSLFGSGEQREMNSPDEFDANVLDYLTKTEARCPGDFAIVPDNSKESGSMRVDSYEIACVGANVSSTASLLFYNDGGTFTVLAHETEAEQMEQAMAVRDQIFASLAGGRDS